MRRISKSLFIAGALTLLFAPAYEAHSATEQWRPQRTSRKRSAPRVQPTTTTSCKTAPGPDLRIIGFASGKARVKNVGQRPAVFSKQARLVTGSSKKVPAGGKIQPGQIVEAPGIDVQWADNIPSNTPTARNWFATMGHSVTVNNWSWYFSIPDPVKVGGLRPLVVDPERAVNECNETNNEFTPVGPNLIKEGGGIKGIGLPDLKVTAVTAKRIISSRVGWIETVTYKNFGTKTSVLCPKVKGSKYTAEQRVVTFETSLMNPSEFHGNRGRSRRKEAACVLVHPGQSISRDGMLIWYEATTTTDEFGVQSVSGNGLEPGCHKLKVVLDPNNDVAESNECNNTTYFYFATGGATCSSSKRTYTPSSSRSCKPRRR